MMKRFLLIMTLCFLPMVHDAVYGQGLLERLAEGVVNGTRKKKNREPGIPGEQTNQVKNKKGNKESSKNKGKSGSEEVTLTVTGTGNTKDKATNNALRSAIEQAYGVFVSANTQILNDDLVKDEIATLTSGNIKDYKEIAYVNMPDGSKEVTVQATVSISKLISYAQSKGASTEFAGATFASNMKMLELNKTNEKTMLQNLLDLVARMMPSCYDIESTMGNPSAGEDAYVVPMTLTFNPNTNAEVLASNVRKTLESLSLTDVEIEDLDRYRMTSTLCTYCYGIDKLPIYFRNDNDVIDKFNIKLKELSVMQLYNFIITDNLGGKSYVDFHIGSSNPYVYQLKGNGLAEVGLLDGNDSDFDFLEGGNSLKKEGNNAWCGFYRGPGTIRKFDYRINFADEPSVTVSLRIPMADITKYTRFDTTVRCRTLQGY